MKNSYKINKAAYRKLIGGGMDQLDRFQIVNEEFITTYNQLLKQESVENFLAYVDESVEIFIKQNIFDGNAFDANTYAVLIYKIDNLKNQQFSYTLYKKLITSFIEKLFEHVIIANNSSNNTYTVPEIQEYKKNILDSVENPIDTDYLEYIKNLYIYYQTSNKEELYYMLKKGGMTESQKIEYLLFTPKSTNRKTNNFYKKFVNSLLEIPDLQKLNDYISINLFKNYNIHKDKVVYGCSDTTYTDDGKIVIDKYDGSYRALSSYLLKKCDTNQKLTVEININTIFEEYTKLFNTDDEKSIRDLEYNSYLSNISNQTDINLYDPNTVKKVLINIFTYHLSEYKRIVSIGIGNQNWLNIFEQYLIDCHNVLFYNNKIQKIDLTYELHDSKNHQLIYEYDNNYMKICDNFQFGIGKYINMIFPCILDIFVNINIYYYYRSIIVLEDNIQNIIQLFETYKQIIDTINSLKRDTESKDIEQDRKLKETIINFIKQHIIINDIESMSNHNLARLENIIKEYKINLNLISYEIVKYLSDKQINRYKNDFLIVKWCMVYIINKDKYAPESKAATHNIFYNYVITKPEKTLQEYYDGTDLIFREYLAQIDNILSFIKTQIHLLTHIPFDNDPKDLLYKLSNQLNIIYVVDKFMYINTDKALREKIDTSYQPFVYGKATDMKNAGFYLSYKWKIDDMTITKINKQIRWYPEINLVTNFCMVNSMKLFSGIFVIKDKYMPEKYGDDIKYSDNIENLELIGLIKIKHIISVRNKQYYYKSFFIFYDTKKSKCIIYSHKGRIITLPSITEYMTVTHRELYTLSQIYNVSIFQSKDIPDIFLISPAEHLMFIPTILSRLDVYGNKIKTPIMPEKTLYDIFKEKFRRVRVFRKKPENNLVMTDNQLNLINYPEDDYNSKDLKLQINQQFIDRLVIT